MYYIITVRTNSPNSFNSLNFIIGSFSKNNSFNHNQNSKQILQLSSEYDELDSESDIDNTNKK